MKSVFELESEIYSSLAHPKRLEILHLLSHQKMTVSQISQMSGLLQAAVSQHLMLLKKLLLVKVEKRAQQRVYSLSSNKIARLLDSTRSLLVSSNVLPTIFIDPVCQMEVTAASAATSLTHEGTVYYFCGTGCEKQFRKHLPIIKEAHV